ncbi:MAG: alanine--tRNA ligase [Gammaproteobacteria bacterium]
MKKMSSAELRSAFLKYFSDHGHSILPSSTLIPANDPTLLFTNAGMVQFKDLFLGREKREYSRAATSQRCVRAGGKHNDLENVGYTARHHTFFEMLGNFSFGDYFKEKAIFYAWDFLTNVLEISPEKLWVTVYEDDWETEKIWLDEIGINALRFSRIGGNDNFWSMGDVGPCGPCTEIFYDHGDDIPGGPPGSPDEDGDRFIEIWNLVFMQYDRAADGSMNPLPKPSVDTGMGLERISAVMQGVHSNYEIDLFRGLLKAAASLVGTDDINQSSLRVIADHIRSCTFLIVDGVLPSNEGRGYVLRRIIRRAIRHGYRLGIRDIFFYKLVSPLTKEMGEAFPELYAAKEQVERVLKAEEIRFAETLDQGMKILESCLDQIGGDMIPGELVFRLYDTYGFPVDLTADFAREHGLRIDQVGFEKAMDAQRDRARAASQFGSDYGQQFDLEITTDFVGYDRLAEKAKISGLYRKGARVEAFDEGDEGIVILDSTPFYAESGGQVGDTGRIIANDAVFEVNDTQKKGTALFLHQGKLLRGCLQLGQQCTAEVDGAERKAIALNHSATHLLHAALRKVLGDHVTQKGSLVNSERLRFDFSHFEPLSLLQIETIERMVNQQIRLNSDVTALLMAKDEAMKAGAMALFGEKYGEEVRVLKIGEFSTELCGGTHVKRAGDIGLFKIIGETGVASGIRRIEAVTGENAIACMEKREKSLNEIAGLLKSSTDMAGEKVQQLLDKCRVLEKELERLKSKVASSAGGELSSLAVDVDGVKVLAIRLDDIDPKMMRDMVDQLKNKLGHAAIVLAAVKDGKVSLIAGVTKELTGSIKAGELVNAVAIHVGGKGGGRPDMAQAGGSDPSGLENALNDVPEWVRQNLKV